LARLVRQRDRRKQSIRAERFVSAGVILQNAVQEEHRYVEIYEGVEGRPVALIDRPSPQSHKSGFMSINGNSGTAHLQRSPFLC
jgi:hypothetical protein